MRTAFLITVDDKGKLSAEGSPTIDALSSRRRYQALIAGTPPKGVKLAYYVDSAGAFKSFDFEVDPLKHKKKQENPSTDKGAK